MNKKVMKLLALLLISSTLSACVGLERKLIAISDHSKHPSFTYQNVIDGGVLVASLSVSEHDIDIPDKKNWSMAVSQAIQSSRKNYKVRSARPLRNAISNEAYLNLVNAYAEDRWIDKTIMADIKDKITERYVVLARLDKVSQTQRSTSRERKKTRKVRTNKKGEKIVYFPGPDTYTLNRTSLRRATISMDVFDLDQDIVVWSGTRNSLLTNSDTYKTDHFVGDNSFRAVYPYPDFPGWFDIIHKTARDLAIHMPHEKDALDELRE